MDDHALREGNVKWDKRFLRLAREVASWSKDPSSKVGAIIVRPDRAILGTGYNGFPRGVSDAPAQLADRGIKYPRTVHAEQNAIYQSSVSLFGCTIYTTLFPCPTCAGGIIQKGISSVISIAAPDETYERWKDMFEHSRDMFDQAGVLVAAYKLEEVLAEDA